MRTGCTIWLTGLSGAGKTTIATELKKRLEEKGMPCEMLDGDVIRRHLSKGLTFSKEDRDENIRRIGFIAEMLSRHGVYVIVAAISPYRDARDNVRAAITNFVEVYVKCSITECERRDSKGLYKKVRNGEIKNFTGITDPYEEPVHPEIICDTEKEDIQKSVNTVIQGLQRLHLLPPATAQ